MNPTHTYAQRPDGLDETMMNALAVAPRSPSKWRARPDDTAYAGGIAYVVISTDGRQVARKVLTGVTILGRSVECDVCLTDGLLSRRHLKLQPLGNGWTIVDLNSRNGILVDGQPVRRAALHDGAVVRAGSCTLLFRQSAAPAAARAQSFRDALDEDDDLAVEFERPATAAAVPANVGDTHFAVGSPIVVFDLGAGSQGAFPAAHVAGDHGAAGPAVRVAMLAALAAALASAIAWGFAAVA